MANLNTKTISAGVGDILAVDGGLTDASTVVQIKDGEGTGSPFYITTTSVGIGASPSYLLDVYNSATAQVRIKGASTLSQLRLEGVKNQVYFSDSTGGSYDGIIEVDGHYMTTYGGDASGNPTTAMLALNLNTGNFGIGTETPACGLDVESAGVAQIRIGRSNSGTTNELGNLYFGNSTDDFLCGVVGLEDGTADSGMLKFNVERTLVGISTAMVIKSSGNVGIGTTQPTTQASADVFLEIEKASGIAGLGLNGGSGSRWELTSDTGDDYIISRNGTARFKIDGSTGDSYTNDASLSSLSDVRIKKDIADLTDGLDIINQLKPKTYKFNGKASMAIDDDVTRYGFIADEVMEATTNYTSVGVGVIDGSEVDDLKSLSMTRMIPMIVKAIQELSAKVTVLENK